MVASVFFFSFIRGVVCESVTDIKIPFMEHLEASKYDLQTYLGYILKDWNVLQQQQQLKFD